MNKTFTFFGFDIKITKHNRALKILEAGSTYQQELTCWLPYETVVKYYSKQLKQEFPPSAVDSYDKIPVIKRLREMIKQETGYSLLLAVAHDYVKRMYNI